MGNTYNNLLSQLHVGIVSTLELRVCSGLNFVMTVHNDKFMIKVGEACIHRNDNDLKHCILCSI